MTLFRTHFLPKIGSNHLNAIENPENSGRMLVETGADVDTQVGGFLEPEVKQRSDGP